MTRQLTVAAVQMDAQPASRDERLVRAERLVAATAKDGAQLVVLPELFNSGYQYTRHNYAIAEPLTGPTRSWMQRLAARYDIHLAGSLLIHDGIDIYNTLLLVAPDGHLWRYDKQYPWGWERAYFRNGRDITVADTALGRIGLLICWDVAHRDLWQQYAGQVHCILISSCPPDVTNSIYSFPNGDQFGLDEFGPFAAESKNTGQMVFGVMLNEQAAWLGVPAINTVGAGHLTTTIPRSRALLLTAVPQSPKLLRYLPRAAQMQMSCAMLSGCKIVDDQGATVAELPAHPADAYTVGAVTLATTPPVPRGEQPPTRLPRSAYIYSDIVLPGLMKPVYQREVGYPAHRRHWLRWGGLLTLGGGISAIRWWLRRRHEAKG